MLHVMKKLLLFFLIVVSQVSFSQDDFRDLSEKLARAKSDSAKAAILIEMSDASPDDSSVYAYALQALELSKRSGYHQGVADAINNLGYVSDKKGDIDRAIALYTQSLQIREGLDDSTGTADCLNNLGNAYFRKGEPLKALDYLLQCLAIREQMKDIDGISSCLNNIAYIYAEQGLVNEALGYYQRSLKIFESTGNLNGVATAYNNMAYLCTDGKQSLEYFKKSLAIQESVGNKEGISAVWNNMGSVYTDLHDYENALAYFTKSLDLKKSTGDEDGAATIMNNIGKIYEEQGQHEVALRYYTEGLELKKKSGQQQGIAYISNNLGNLYYKMKNYSAAETMGKLSITVSQALGYPVNIRNAAGTLALIYAAQQNYREAYGMHQLYKTMSDSVNFSESRKAASKKQQQFEFDLKEAASKASYEKKQALSKKEIEKQKLARNFTVAGFSLVLCISGLFFYQINQRRKSKFQQTVSEVEMKALRAQMNPHFIFNSLLSINRYMHEKDTATASDYLTRFAKVMRMILEHSQHQEVPLADDLKALELYMQLESLRMNHKFSYSIQVDDAIDQENILIPPLILQPFVENAIWHGFSTKEGKGNLLIRIEKNNEMLQCTVEDDGVGRTQSAMVKPQQAEKKSLGMKITKSRIDIINRIRKTNAGIELTDLAQGMRVVVTLPLELAY